MVGSGGEEICWASNLSAGCDDEDDGGEEEGEEDVMKMREEEEIRARVRRSF